MVAYASGGEGSWKSLFTTVPKVLCKCKGSAVPHIAPQVRHATHRPRGGCILTANLTPENFSSEIFLQCL